MLTLAMQVDQEKSLTTYFDIEQMDKERVSYSHQKIGSGLLDQSDLGLHAAPEQPQGI